MVKRKIKGGRAAVAPNRTATGRRAVIAGKKTIAAPNTSVIAPLQRNGIATTREPVHVLSDRQINDCQADQCSDVSVIDCQGAFEKAARFAHVLHAPV